MSRWTWLGGGLATAGVGAVVVADRRIRAARRVGRQALPRFAEPPADRYDIVHADDGVPLYVRQDGPVDAAVTVVLAHGFTLDHREFLFQRGELRQRFGPGVRVIGYDHRGHGRSGPGSSSHATIDQLGRDLHTVITELAPSGPVVLVGHSMGGMTIMALAAAHPELFGPRGRVAGVGLLDTSTGRLGEVTLGLPAALARAQAPVLPLLLRGAGLAPGLVERGRARTSDVAWAFVRRIAFAPGADPALVEFLSATIARTRIEAIADYYATLMRHDKLAALATLRGTRTVIVCGERDLLTPPEHSRAMAAALPDAELVLVPDAGHQALMERPEPVNAALTGLVQAAIEARVGEPSEPRP